MDWSEDKDAYYAFNPKFDEDELNDDFFDEDNDNDLSDDLTSRTDCGKSLTLNSHQQENHCFNKDELLSVLDEIVILTPFECKDITDLLNVELETDIVKGVSLSKIFTLEFSSKVWLVSIEKPKEIKEKRWDTTLATISMIIEENGVTTDLQDSLISTRDTNLTKTIYADLICFEETWFYRVEDKLLYHDTAIKNGAFCYKGLWFRSNKEWEVYMELVKYPLKITPNQSVKINNNWYELDLVVEDSTKRKGVIELNGTSHNGRSDYDHEKRRKVMDKLNLDCYEIYSNKKKTSLIVTDFLKRFNPKILDNK